MEIIKLNAEGTLIDISVKQTGGLCTVDFITFLAEKVGKENLLKKSILMLKSWMTYEASLLGSHAANMATYALYVLVIFLINNFYEELETPLQVFHKFFTYFGKFDWDQKIVTIYGPIRTLNFYDRLKNEFNFDTDKMALAERVKHEDLAHRPLLIQP